MPFSIFNLLIISQLWTYSHECDRILDFVVAHNAHLVSDLVGCHFAKMSVFKIGIVRLAEEYYNAPIAFFVFFRQNLQAKLVKYLGVLSS